MKNALLASGLILGGMLVVADRATAHHSFAAEFDSKKPIKLKGVVTKVDWTNPHVWIHLNVKDESGKVTNWERKWVRRTVYREAAGAATR